MVNPNEKQSDGTPKLNAIFCKMSESLLRCLAQWATYVASISLAGCQTRSNGSPISSWEAEKNLANGNSEWMNKGTSPYPEPKGTKVIRDALWNDNVNCLCGPYFIWGHTLCIDEKSYLSYFVVLKSPFSTVLSQKYVEKSCLPL